MPKKNKDEQAQLDLLNFMQMEALGITRREKITTSDFKENKDYMSVSLLEDRRKVLGGNYKPAKKGQLKILDWKNIYRSIEDDGTLAAGDRQSVNEGLGQTHRAKLLGDDSVRNYSGEPGRHKARLHNKPMKAVKAAMAPARVTRGRVVKGNSSSPAALKGKPSPATISHGSLSPARVPIRRRSPATIIHQGPPLADPKDWLTSIQGLQKAALKTASQLDPGPKPKVTQLPTHEAKPKSTKQVTPEAKPESAKRVTPEAKPESSQRVTPEDANISVALLLSLGVKLTQEQLRALTAQVRKDPGDGKAPTPSDRKILETSSAQDNIHEVVVQRPKANDQKVTKPSIARDQVLPQPKEHVGVDDQKISRTSPAKHKTAKNDANFPAARAQNQVTKENIGVDDQKISRTSAVKHQTVKNGVNKPTPRPQDEVIEENRGVNDQEISRQSAVKHQTAKNDLKIPTLRSHLEMIRNANSQTDTLRHQREMIIGSQIYKNRYSVVAGSLVDSFRKMSLMDPSPNPEPTPIAQDQPTTHNKVATQPATKAPPAAPALRPRFIPDAPSHFPTVTPPAALAPKTVNPADKLENPFGPSKRSRRAAPPSLPAHLLGKVASTDHGAAARAQYGG